MKRKAVVFAGLLAALAACQVIAGIEPVAKVDGTGTSGSSSSSGNTTSTGGPPDPCQHATVPEIDKEKDTNDPGPDLEPIWIATQTISLTKPAKNGLFGFDLDRSCTCDPRPETAFKGAGSCKAPKEPGPCDPDGGIDNQGSVLFGTSLLAAANLDQDLLEDITEGKRTVMLFVRGWNGKPNDLDVRVGLFVSNGTHKDPGTGNRTKPLFEGNDEWTWQSPAELTNGAVALNSAGKGFVRNGRLIARADGDVSIYFGTAAIRFGGAAIVGDLTYDASKKIARFSGILGGRIPVTDMLVAAGQLKVKEEAGKIEYGCENSAFPLVAASICSGVDIPSADTFDNKDPPGLCDAISSSVALDGVSAKILANEKDIFELPADNPCVPGGTAAPAGGYKCN